MLFSEIFIRDIEDSNPLVFVVTIELLKQFKKILAKGKRKKKLSFFFFQTYFWGYFLFFISVCEKSITCRNSESCINFKNCNLYIKIKTCNLYSLFSTIMVWLIMNNKEKVKSSCENINNYS